MQITVSKDTKRAGKNLSDLLQYEQYLVAFEMAQGKYDMAKKRLDFMKEELKWENTTLVHTCNVLAKKQN